MQNIFSELKTDSRFIRFVMKVGSPSPMDPDEQHRRIPAVFVLMIISVATAVSGIYHCSSGKNPLWFWTSSVLSFPLSCCFISVRKKSRHRVRHDQHGFCSLVLCGDCSGQNGDVADLLGPRPARRMFFHIGPENGYVRCRILFLYQSPADEFTGAYDPIKTLSGISGCPFQCCLPDPDVYALLLRVIASDADSLHPA